MITTIPDYCKQRGVTRQFVYEYIKRGKFKHFEMPTFVEMNGEKIHIGVQKILEVPDEFAPKKSDLKPIIQDNIGELEDLIQRLTDEPEIQNFYRYYLTLPVNADKKAAKATMYATINQHPDCDRLHQALEEANIKLMQHIVQMNTYMENVVSAAMLEAA